MKNNYCRDNSHISGRIGIVELLFQNMGPNFHKFYSYEKLLVHFCISHCKPVKKQTNHLFSVIYFCGLLLYYSMLCAPPFFNVPLKYLENILQIVHLQNDDVQHFCL